MNNVLLNASLFTAGLLVGVGVWLYQSGMIRVKGGTVESIAKWLVPLLVLPSVGGMFWVLLFLIAIFIDVVYWLFTGILVKNTYSFALSTESPAYIGRWWLLLLAAVVYILGCAYFDKEQ